MLSIMCMPAVRLPRTPPVHTSLIYRTFILTLWQIIYIQADGNWIYRDITPLHVANDGEIAALLLDRGAKVNAKDKVIWFAYGETAYARDLFGIAAVEVVGVPQMRGSPLH